MSETDRATRTTNYIAVMKAGSFDGERVFFDDTHEPSTRRAYEDAQRLVAVLTETNPATGARLPPRVAFFRKPLHDGPWSDIPAIVDTPAPRFAKRTVSVASVNDAPPIVVADAEVRGCTDPQRADVATSPEAA